MQSEKFSPRVKSDPQAPLLFGDEARSYADRIVSKRSPWQKKWIEQSSEKIRRSAKPGVSDFVCIVSHVSEPHLERALLCYGMHRSETGKTHFVLFLNGVGPAAEFRRKEKEINSALKKLHFAGFTLLVTRFKKRAPIGTVRGLAVDAIVFSALSLGIKDPKVISHDSDQVALSPKYFREIDAPFREKIPADICGGKALYAFNGRGKTYLPNLPALPEIFLQSRYFASILVLTPGNFKFRLASYCASGGYHYDSEFGEGIQLWNNISFMRKAGKKSGAAARAIEEGWIVYDPRRFVRTVLRGGHAVEYRKYDRFESTVDYSRALRTEDLLSKLGRRSDLLQASEVKAAQGGSAAALKKVKERIRFAFFRPWLSGSPLINPSPEDYAALLRRAGAFGLSLRSLEFSRLGSNPIPPKINWEESPVVQDLFRAFR